jgi:hypothetical protein
VFSSMDDAQMRAHEDEVFEGSRATKHSRSPHKLLWNLLAASYVGRFHLMQCCNRHRTHLGEEFYPRRWTLHLKPDLPSSLPVRRASFVWLVSSGKSAQFLFGCLSTTAVDQLRGGYGCTVLSGSSSDSGAG